MSERAAGAFPDTRWSAVAAARSADPAERERALAVFAASYWRPVYTYLRLRWGQPAADAEDLTQEFFARLLERDFLASYDPSRARLRTFLRVGIDRLLANQTRDSRRLKRGGGALPVPLDREDAERALAGLAAARAENAEEFFAREWTRSFLGLVVGELRKVCAGGGKDVHFRLFARYDLEDGPPGDDRRPSYADLAREVGVSPSDVTNHLAWARREFRRIALARLRELTASDEEYRLEARSLFGLTPP